MGLPPIFSKMSKGGVVGEITKTDIYGPEETEKEETDDFDKVVDMGIDEISRALHTQMDMADKVLFKQGIKSIIKACMAQSKMEY